MFRVIVMLKGLYKWYFRSDKFEHKIDLNVSTDQIDLFLYVFKQMIKLWPLENTSILTSLYSAAYRKLIYFHFGL